MKVFKQKIFDIIDHPRPDNKASRIFGSFIVSLILLSFVAIILESFETLAAQYNEFFRFFETFSIGVFTIEYLLRIWTADLHYPNERHPRLKYVFSILALFDLLSILPFYLPFVTADLRFFRMVRLLRLTRLFRLAKLGRYLESLQTIARVLKESSMQLLAAVGLCMLVLVFSSILMYSVESPAQPEAFPNVFAAFWWAVCTLTTVGYGDVYPITGLGKFVAAIISIMGIGIIAIPTGIITAGFNDAMVKKHAKMEAERICPHCGKSLNAK